VFDQLSGDCMVIAWWLLDQWWLLAQWW